MTALALGERFQALHDRLMASLDEADRSLIRAVVGLKPDTRRTYGFDDFTPQTKQLLTTIAELPEPRAGTASRAVIAGLAAANAQRLTTSLTPLVRRLSQEALERLLGWLEEDSQSYHFPEDAFLKDYRFVTGMTVPCGSQVVDLAERPGVKTMVSLLGKSPPLAWHAAMSPWFKPHTDSRHLVDFNEDGWNRCYVAMADLMTMMPRVAGMVATSWFYDPKVTEISPRLAYLRRVPMEAGAVTISHGTSQFDIDSATATSPSRRELYEKGEYLPTCWSILWPRDAMLAWADAYRAAHPDDASL